MQSSTPSKNQDNEATAVCKRIAAILEYQYKKKCEVIKLPSNKYQIKCYNSKNASELAKQISEDCNKMGLSLEQAKQISEEGNMDFDLSFFDLRVQGCSLELSEQVICYIQSYIIIPAISVEIETVMKIIKDKKKDMPEDTRAYLEKLSSIFVKKEIKLESKKLELEAGVLEEAEALEKALEFIDKIKHLPMPENLKIAMGILATACVMLLIIINTSFIPAAYLFAAKTTTMMIGCFAGGYTFFGGRAHKNLQEALLTASLSVGEEEKLTENNVLFSDNLKIEEERRDSVPLDLFTRAFFGR
ncbi:MAG: hypothetical protein K0S27_227 [Gammaproteobacteria bacterium]|jgi:hypothetical protein|nr:hypothetical protein [Gammaproteobacteria bacterium]